MLPRKLYAGTFALALAGAALVSNAEAAKVAESDEFLTAKVVIAQYVRAARGVTSIRVPVNIDLTNVGKEDLEVQSPTVCQVHDYVITKPNNDVIYKKPQRSCAQAVEKQVIKAGETISATTAIKVPTNLFAEGRRYFLKYQFWGVQAKAPLRVHFND